MLIAKSWFGIYRVLPLNASELVLIHFDFIPESF